MTDPGADNGSDRPAGRVEVQDRKLDGALDPKTAGLLVIDSTGDGSADLLAWSHNGISLYRKGRELVANSGLQDIRGVISVAAGDFDNDGLTDLCVLTETGASLYRNTKGRFEKKDAALPAGRFETAVWLDFDHDYDLDLFLLGAKSVLLRNEEGVLRDYTAHFPFAAGHALAAIPLRVVPIARASIWRSPTRPRRGALRRPSTPRRKWQTTLVAAPFARLPQSGEVRGQPSFSLTIQQYSIPTMSPISRQTDNFLNQ